MNMLKRRLILVLVLLGLLTNMVYSQEGPKNPIDAYECSTKIFHSLFPDNGKYTVQEHSVVTADKYNLRVFRVGLTPQEFQKLPQKLQDNSKRTVWLNHGIIDSSDAFFMNDEAKSPGFYLVNKGFDVWVGNNRGNKYSHSTSVQDMTQEEFFNYSFQEYAEYDVPAIYRHVLEFTSKDRKITWIGHSQGNQQFFAALSDPETSDFINANTERFIALAPIVFLTNIEPEALKWISQATSVIDTVASWISVNELASSSCKGPTQWTRAVGTICDTWPDLCGGIFTIMGQNSEYNDAYVHSEKYLLHHPCGTSRKNLIHMAQAINDDTNAKIQFAKYNYGEEENVKKYGQKEPPVWDLKKIKVPMTFIAGNNDKLSKQKDVDYLITQLNNKDLAEQHWLDNWDHVSFLFSKDPTPFFEILNKVLNITE